jgi:hydroxyacyl-ACP dehydratase HTD2-like protein with hotdog domain
VPIDKSWIGRTGEPVTMHVELGKVREFARSIKDDDPVYSDAERAGETGGVMPPVTFLQTLSHWSDSPRLRPPMDLRRVLHGEQEFEFFKPIVVGDILTAVVRIADLYDKPGKRGGTMTFCVMETDFTNHRGELVARGRATSIETGQVVKD